MRWATHTNNAKKKRKKYMRTSVFLHKSIKTNALFFWWAVCHANIHPICGCMFNICISLFFFFLREKFFSFARSLSLHSLTFFGSFTIGCMSKGSTLTCFDKKKKINQPNIHRSQFYQYSIRCVYCTRFYGF